MSAILLAAGYGTRLYPLTKDRPKALLALGHGVVLDVILEALTVIPGLSRTVLVTNHRFLNQFQAWRATRHVHVEILDDGSSSPETRLGAIPDLRLGLSQVGPIDDVVVVGADNVFSWSLADFVAFANTKRPAATMALGQVASSEEASRYGVVDLDPQGRLIRCVEKPTHPTSLTVGLCVYYFPAPCRHRMDAFVTGKGNLDAPGHFIAWLVKHEPVYGFVTRGDWFDIGSQDTYRQAVQRWSGLLAPRQAVPRGSRRRPTTRKGRQAEQARRR